MRLVHLRGCVGRENPGKWVGEDIPVLLFSLSLWHKTPLSVGLSLQQNRGDGRRGRMALREEGKFPVVWMHNSYQSLS